LVKHEQIKLKALYLLHIQQDGGEVLNVREVWIDDQT